MRPKHSRSNSSNRRSNRKQSRHIVPDKENERHWVPVLVDLRVPHTHKGRMIGKSRHGLPSCSPLHGTWTFHEAGSLCLDPGVGPSLIRT
jgi:hypothetical protein